MCLLSHRHTEQVFAHKTERVFAKHMFAERVFAPNKCSPMRQRSEKCLTVSPVDKPVDNLVADYK